MKESLDTIEIEVDSELLRQVEELIQPMGINTEQLIQMFFAWVVNPDTQEEAITQLLKWKEQYDHKRNILKSTSCDSRTV